MIGRTISHYRIVAKLCENAEGVVYKAEDATLKRHVALKFLSAETVGSEADRRKFMDQARVAAGIAHPNICTVYEVDEVDGRVFVAMAYVDGVDLRERIGGAAMERSAMMSIATQIAEALEAAHSRGVIHGALRPNNVLIGPAGAMFDRMCGRSGRCFTKW